MLEAAPYFAEGPGCSSIFIYCDGDRSSIKMFHTKGLIQTVLSRLATPAISPVACKCIHTTSQMFGVRDPAQNKTIKAHAEYYDDYWSRDLEGWSDLNKVLYPPSKPGDPLRPAEIYHGRALIRYSPKKLWYMSKIVMNMNVDEAISYLGFINTKGAKIVAEVLAEAQEIAVNDHNVEFKSNLHVASSFVYPAGCRKIAKYHGKGRVNQNRSRFSNYYILVREGIAPEWRPRATAYSAAVEYVNGLRMRTIQDGL